MEVRQYRQLFKNLLNDVANSVIVVALLIYPIVWVLNISSDIQQEVNFKLYVNYVLIAFFGKQLGRLFILLWSRRSKKNKGGSEKAWWQCTVRLTNVYKTGDVVNYFHNISQIYKHHEKDFTIYPAVFMQLCLWLRWWATAWNTALPMTYSTPIRCNLNVAYLPTPSRL